MALTSTTARLGLSSIGPGHATASRGDESGNWLLCHHTHDGEQPWIDEMQHVSPSKLLTKNVLSKGPVVRKEARCMATGAGDKAYLTKAAWLGLRLHSPLPAAPLGNRCEIATRRAGARPASNQDLPTFIDSVLMASLGGTSPHQARLHCCPGRILFLFPPLYLLSLFFFFWASYVVGWQISSFSQPLRYHVRHVCCCRCG